MSKDKKKIKSISEYRVGMKINGITIEKIYFSNNIIKFIIIKGKRDQEEGEIHVFGGNSTEIDHLLSETKFLIYDLKLKSEDKEIFNYQRANSINSFLNGEKDIGKKTLQELLLKLQQRKTIKKKLWYIGIFFGIVMIMIALSIQNTIFLDYKKYIKISTLGSIGGFISLNLKLEKIQFEISESTVSYIIISIYKVVFSMLTSIICYFLIESNLIFGILNSSNTNNMYFIYSISALSGFSESLLPNIFKKIEEKAMDNKQTK